MKLFIILYPDALRCYKVVRCEDEERARTFISDIYRDRESFTVREISSQGQEEILFRDWD